MGNIDITNWSLQLLRGYQGPLDAHGYFPTIEDANEYLSKYANANVWEGQTISIGTGDEVAIYIVKKTSEGAWFLEESGGAIKKFSSSEDLLAFAVDKNIGKLAYLTEGDNDYTAGVYVVIGGEDKVSKLAQFGDVNETLTNVDVAKSSLDAELQGKSTKLVEANKEGRKVTLTPVIGKLKLDGTVESEGLATVNNVKNYVDNVFAWEEVETITTTTPAPPIEGE